MDDAMSIPARLYNQSLDYLKGKGVPRDETKAYALNAEAAEFGDRDAVLAMGWFYLNGIGVEQDFDKAEYWYRRLRDTATRERCLVWDR
jgi:TPR repeat protein